MKPNRRIIQANKQGQRTRTSFYVWHARKRFQSRLLNRPINNTPAARTSLWERSNTASRVYYRAIRKYFQDRNDRLMDRFDWPHFVSEHKRKNKEEQIPPKVA